MLLLTLRKAEAEWALSLKQENLQRPLSGAMSSDHGDPGLLGLAHRCSLKTHSHERFRSFPLVDLPLTLTEAISNE